MTSVSVFPFAAEPELLARIHRRCIFDPETGCIVWTGAKSTQGRYGTLGFDGTVIYVHRAAYFAAHGHIPSGSLFHESDSVEIHHECGNRLGRRTSSRSRTIRCLMMTSYSSFAIRSHPSSQCSSMAPSSTSPTPTPMASSSALRSVKQASTSRRASSGARTRWC